MNSLKDLLEKSKIATPMILGSSDMVEPIIPYKGLGIPLPKNLPEETKYAAGALVKDSSRINELLKIVLLNQNNILEILSFLVFRQGPEGQENIEILLEQNLGKTIEVLEQNRISIKKDLENIQNLNNENYKTVSKQLDRISRLILEQKIEELSKSLEQLEKKVSTLEVLPEKLEKFNQILNRLEKSVDNLDNKL